MSASSPSANSPSFGAAIGRLGRLARSLSPEAWGWIGAGLGVAGFLGALAMQHLWGLEPCPLCIFQRVALIASSVACAVSALAARFAPRAARWVFRFAALLALVGMGIAAKHMHVMWVPQEVSCGPELEYLMDAFPPSQWLPKVFSGGAECAAAAKQLVLGLPIPVWSALLFLTQAGAALWAARLSRPARPA